MSFSPQARQRALCDALALMLARLGESAVCDEHFYINEEPFSKIPNTTWRELEQHGFVESCDTIGHPQRRLTGLGWLSALIVNGRASRDAVLDPDLRAKLSKLTATMKDAVKGRHEDAYTYVDQLARASGLPETFIINVMESGIIDQCFKMRGAEWEEYLKLIRVPLDFGLPPLSGAE